MRRRTMKMTVSVPITAPIKVSMGGLVASAEVPEGADRRSFVSDRPGWNLAPVDPLLKDSWRPGSDSDSSCGNLARSEYSMS